LRKGGKVGLYKVIFLGLTVAGPEEEARLLGGLQKKFHLSPERAESLLQRVPIVVKKGISQEEMEKYVHAFREIGGRVKVEEEPVPEEQVFQEPSPVESAQREPAREEPARTEPEIHQEPRVSEGAKTFEEPKAFDRSKAYEMPEEPEEPKASDRPKPERRAYAGAMVTCPQCGFEQPETDECVKCGIIISKLKQYEEMARTYEGQVREISSEEYSPWESGEGFFSAFFNTTKEALFSPTRFFRKVGEGEGMWSPLIYGVIAGIIGNFGALFTQWLIFTRFLPSLLGGMLPAFSFNQIFIGQIILMPFKVVLSILIISLIVHLCLMIVGGRKKGFETTFRVVSYCWSGFLFGIIPIIGGLIGLIYAIVLAIFGVREGHGISTGKSVLAVLLPWIIIVSLIILFAIFIPLFFASFMHFGGVRV
jgi:hypothetical protein